MMCPYCQNEMEEGYIPFNSPFVLKWVSMIDKKKVRISDKIKWSEVAKIKNIHYCKECCVFIKKIQDIRFVLFILNCSFLQKNGYLSGFFVHFEKK